MPPVDPLGDFDYYGIKEPNFSWVLFGETIQERETY
jgi:hypothetical protein